MHIDKETKVNIIILISSALLYAAYNTYRTGNVYLTSPDGSLYLSIARNFLDNGHFIQMSRPYEIGFIVPPGLPFIYTVLMFFFGKNVYGIVAVQYIIFGATIILLYNTTLLLIKIKPVAILTCFLYFGATIILEGGNPGYCLTETWYIFGIAIFLRIYFSELNRKNLWMLVDGICLMMIRPSLSVFLLFSVIQIIKEALSQKRIKKEYIITVSVLLIVLLFNALNNYRETESIVLLENYGGESLYLANNPNTKTDVYGSYSLSEMSEERYKDITSDTSLTRGQKNEIFSSWAKEFIINNTFNFIDNT